MKKAAISDLKACLSEYLAKVKRGEEVVVTDRGHPVAKLIPFSTGKGPHESERERLAREGILDLGTGRMPREFFQPPPVQDPHDSVLKALLEEREEGR